MPRYVNWSSAWGDKKKRKPFTIKKRKIEWMLAAGRSGSSPFVKTSKCRVCKRKLTWGDHTYDFDHKDNNQSNDSQKNCYLVCVICHRKATVIGTRKIKNALGQTVGHKSIKKKVGYKKPKKKKTTKKKRKRKSSGGLLDIKIPKFNFGF